jgi:hypothetical protein
MDGFPFQPSFWISPVWKVYVNIYTSQNDAKNLNFTRVLQSKCRQRDILEYLLSEHWDVNIACHVNIDVAFRTAQEILTESHHSGLQNTISRSRHTIHMRTVSTCSWSQCLACWVWKCLDLIIFTFIWSAKKDVLAGQRNQDLKCDADKQSDTAFVTIVVLRLRFRMIPGVLRDSTNHGVQLNVEIIFMRTLQGWLTGSQGFGWRTVSRDADRQFTRELFLHVPKVHI